jgi:hypothetical protein
MKLLNDKNVWIIDNGAIKSVNSEGMINLIVLEIVIPQWVMAAE